MDVPQPSWAADDGDDPDGVHALTAVPTAALMSGSGTDWDGEATTAQPPQSPSGATAAASTRARTTTTLSSTTDAAGVTRIRVSTTADMDVVEDLRRQKLVLFEARNRAALMTRVVCSWTLPAALVVGAVLKRLHYVAATEACDRRFCHEWREARERAALCVAAEAGFRGAIAKQEAAERAALVPGPVLRCVAQPHVWLEETLAACRFCCDAAPALYDAAAAVGLSSPSRGGALSRGALSGGGGTASHVSQCLVALSAQQQPAAGSGPSPEADVGSPAGLGAAGRQLLRCGGGGASDATLDEVHRALACAVATAAGSAEPAVASATLLVMAIRAARDAAVAVVQRHMHRDGVLLEKELKQRLARAIVERDARFPKLLRSRGHVAENVYAEALAERAVLRLECDEGCRRLALEARGLDPCHEGNGLSGLATASMVFASRYVAQLGHAFERWRCGVELAWIVAAEAARRGGVAADERLALRRLWRRGVLPAEANVLLEQERTARVQLLAGALRARALLDAHADKERRMIRRVLDAAG